MKNDKLALRNIFVVILNINRASGRPLKKLNNPRATRSPFLGGKFEYLSP